MDVKCQCGHIAFQTPTATPMTVYHCHCTECRAQSASAFGTSAIFPSKGILPLSDELQSRLKVWTRPGSNGVVIDCYFCERCGCRVMHVDRHEDGRIDETVSIKGGLVRGMSYEGAAHIWTKSAVVTIPDGVERWPGEPPDE
ncbi:hypothetical protein B0A48_10029 [Cryoendolithus antarcticus]|uniref:CENP-V/GFA domain-containing protein n=1 Tax=Cryoendolithus antarcticus TaxID=1507870 RepID=A0A1V8T3E1_9PEZI|nr:hypothetical protein B0A48_10029 [Cryoendolithus antarcticus]